ncbi:hypothetical protein P4O66_006351 [Electrophorus voltai]|uniref:Translocon-associated protein subunit alpha n=1 Tax=Electrophorus voltai TaxID=2609070 RepID=A0AAD8ZIJ7_9TELE|nr:hypothetical protein P4O66_006351 [Electrophorus voltai]
MYKFCLNLFLVFLLPFPCGLNAVGTVFAETDAEQAYASEDAAVEEGEDDEDEALVEETQTGDKFTALPLGTVIKPNKQASFEYSFIPAQPMAGRPFGLVILLNYLDSEGGAFQSAVYNQTVTITEVDECLDGETIFMYIFLSGLFVLMVFGMYQVLESRMKKRVPMKVETSTGGLNDADISWIPPETLNIMSKFRHYFHIILLGKINIIVCMESQNIL